MRLQDKDLIIHFVLYSLDKFRIQMINIYK
jgi:hypothetical protein